MRRKTADVHYVVRVLICVEYANSGIHSNCNADKPSEAVLYKGENTESDCQCDKEWCASWIDIESSLSGIVSCTTQSHTPAAATIAETIVLRIFIVTPPNILWFRWNTPYINIYIYRVGRLRTKCVLQNKYMLSIRIFITKQKCCALITLIFCSTRNHFWICTRYITCISFSDIRNSYCII